MSGFKIAPVVLFDLDGTLVDSSGDLAAALNAVRASLGLAPIATAQIRSAISVGARAILSQGIPEQPAEALIASHLDAFFEHYLACLGTRDHLFDGIPEVLTAIEAQGSRWGIVSNKREDLARLVIERLGLDRRCAVLIGGNTLARSKPDPLPVVTACQRLGIEPSQAVFIGDDARDIEAGRAAGTGTVAVRWGFHADADDPACWGADFVLETPQQLLHSGALTRP